MNRTTEDSRKLQTLVGGETIPQEDGKIEMPPENSKNVEEILNYIIAGMFQDIKTGNCTAQDMNFSKEQMEQLKENRKERKTQKALQRRAKAANQR